MKAMSLMYDDMLVKVVSLDISRYADTVFRKVRFVGLDPQLSLLRLGPVHISYLSHPTGFIDV